MRLIATVIAVLLVATTLTIGLVNFAIGCGEPEYHADGTFVTGQNLQVNGGKAFG